MTQAYIREWAYVPLEYLGPARLVRVKKTLTITPKQFRDEAPKTIRLYSEKVPGFLGCPIEWALLHFPELGFEDRTVLGGECYYNKLPDPSHSNAAPGQAQFMADLDAAMAEYYTVSVKGATGSGKTVVFLASAAKRGRRTLVILHRQRLARQWAHALHEHLGIPYDDIGWVQGSVCNYDHPFVIAVSNTLVERSHPSAFYEAFGTIGYDEGHRLGAPFFSHTVGLFPAQCKVMLSATDRRKDGADKVFHYYFGNPPKVISEQPALFAIVHAMDYACNLPRWATKPGHIASLLGQDEDRNDIIQTVIGKLYRAGRQALFIGASVEHLQRLIATAKDRGIPESAMGLYVDQKYTGKTRKSYTKPKALARRDRVLYWKPAEGHDAAFPQHTEVVVTEVVGRGHYRVEALGRTEVVHIDEVRNRGVDKPALVRVSHEELDYIADHCQLLFATYGIFREGTDIRRLDAGMDVTPQAEGEQVIGRIRRPDPGKLTPEWYTIRDTGHAVTERMAWARIRDYEKSNCEVQDHGRV